MLMKLTYSELIKLFQIAHITTASNKRSFSVLKLSHLMLVTDFALLKVNKRVRHVLKEKCEPTTSPKQPLTKLERIQRPHAFRKPACK